MCAMLSMRDWIVSRALKMDRSSILKSNSQIVVWVSDLLKKIGKCR